MFVLKFKKGITRKLYNPSSKKFEERDLSDKYVRYIPHSHTTATTELNEAKVYNTKQEAVRDWEYQSCQLVPVNVTIKEEVS